MISKEDLQKDIDNLADWKIKLLYLYGNKELWHDEYFKRFKKLTLVNNNENL